jgi:hemolysin activation/secretion protein
VLERIQSIGGSSQKRFWDTATSTGARTGAQRHFKIVALSANHSRFLDTDKVQRLLGSFKYIRPDERLVPAKMTTFGGMYSVRGYKESRIVADGGILGSVQYEYDLIRKSEAGRTISERSQNTKRELKKIAPLVFFDYGRANTKDHVAGEKGTEELFSLGLGMIVEHGEHFNAGIYYGHPLRSAGDTKKGNGRLHVGFTMRF